MADSTAIQEAPGMKDQRVVYGVSCTWWDSIDKVGRHRGLPCCPHCKSLLFERPSENDFIDGARKYEANGHPGYVDFLYWARGKCFPNFDTARSAYEASGAGASHG